MHHQPETGKFSQEINLTNNPAEDRYPDWSPDGRKILFESNRTGNWDIYHMNSDGSGLKVLTRDTSDERQPDWHPDAKSILFESNRNGKFELFQLHLKTGGIQQLFSLESESFEASFGQFSPDGSEIAFTAVFPETESKYEILVYHISKDSLRSISSDYPRSLYPRWSKQGDQILFFARRHPHLETDQIYSMRPDGSDVRRITEHGHHQFCPSWSANGKQFVCAVSQENSRPELFIFGLDGKEKSRLTNNDYGETLPDWSPDGKKIAITAYRNGNYEICILFDD